jgi:hypothetical protein
MAAKSSSSKGKLFGKPRSEVIKNPGAFTRKAKAAGESTSKLASSVKANPSKFSPQTRKQAALDRSFETMRSRRK